MSCLFINFYKSTTMKRLLLILVVCAALTSCRWIHETFYPVDSCAEWYSEKLYDAVLNDDVDEFIEVYNNYTKWVESLDPSDRNKADRASDKWAEKNVDQNKLIDFAQRHYEEVKEYI